MSAVDSPSPYPEPGPVRSDEAVNGVAVAMDTDEQLPADGPMVLGKLFLQTLLVLRSMD